MRLGELRELGNAQAYDFSFERCLHDRKSSLNAAVLRLSETKIVRLVGGHVHGPGVRDEYPGLRGGPDAAQPFPALRPLASAEGGEPVLQYDVDLFPPAQRRLRTSAALALTRSRISNTRDKGQSVLKVDRRH